MNKDDLYKAVVKIGPWQTLLLIAGGACVLIAVVWMFITNWPLVILAGCLVFLAMKSKRHRRTLSWSAVLLVALAVVIPGERSGAPATSNTALPSSSPAPVTLPSASAAPAGSVPRATADSRVLVTNVINGDTFEIEGGTRVRVLGIDSCEANTPGGQDATRMARRILLLTRVTLRSEPGVDKDRYGRALRYVGTQGGDFGKLMVAEKHTGVYQGHNDASPAYIADLRTYDSDGRDCSGTPTANMPNVNVYNPNLPNVDVDHDSDHHESRFCRKHWWC